VISNADLRQRRVNAIPRGISNATAIAAARGRNAELWDVEGNRYLDFAAGIAVLNTGHSHPRVTSAAKEQIDRFSHTCFQVVAYEPYIALAERLNALAPFSGEAQTLFFSTGAEAVENAIKIARRGTGRSGVVTFTGAFHGRSLLALAMTGTMTPYKAGFGTLPSGVHHLPFPSGPVTTEESLRALDLLFQATIHPEQVAAIVVEPVQGEGGFNPAPADLLRGLRAICDRHGIVLIADEIQTGFARTGRMFAIEHSGVEPDLVTVAKALGGGFPISGIIGRKTFMDACDPGELGGTYAGSPVACAAALAVLDVIEDENLLQRASEIGAVMKERISKAGARNAGVRISSPRGMGAMVAFDVLDGNGEPAPALAKEVLGRALDEGLIALSCGMTGQAIRLLPPLTIEDDHLAEGLDMLDRALAGGEAQ
jgi:4-aminobutyrate aminotransferase/(S)-3-amino-2-methylpropionate transaminase